MIKDYKFDIFVNTTFLQAFTGVDPQDIFNILHATLNDMLVNLKGAKVEDVEFTSLAKHLLESLRAYLSIKCRTRYEIHGIVINFALVETSNRGIVLLDVMPAGLFNCKQSLIVHPYFTTKLTIN